jgi:predicted NAD/FAD-binding protein
MATYDDVRDNLDTGDIVLFSGKGLISMGLKIGALCTWSHVAMVVRVREPDVALLYQATPVCKAKDFMDGVLKNGVQINVMSEAVKGYNGKVAVRHLSVARTPDMLTGLSQFRQEVKDRPYEDHIIQMVKAVWDGPLGHVEEDLSSLFCSELVGEAYQRMGLLPDNECGGRPCTEYTPKDFSTEGGGLELLLGASLGEEIVIREG